MLQKFLAAGLCLTFGAALTASACSSASSGGGGGSGGGTGATSGTGGGIATGGDSGVIDSPVSDGNLTGDTACALFTAEAKQSPAALTILLDRSTSMQQGSKWTTAQLAIVQAIDLAAFDNLALGLQVFPVSDVTGPACAFNLPVSCGVTALPQVPLSDTGTAKSNQPGVRQQIYNWLSTNSPNGSATPGYDALKAAINALQIYPLQGTRIVILITDGGFGCTSLSSPLRPNYGDSLGCPDWEHPNNVVDLLKSAYEDSAFPVRTFVVGVPGADTKNGDPEAPPYSMRRALSAFAYAGSPDTVPAGCDGSYVQGAGDPATSCHYDLTQGSFSPATLAQSLSEARGKALGCSFALPEPPPGQTLDKGKVNVNVTTDGNLETLKKRSNPGDSCSTDGCWDYDSTDQVILIGKACEDVKKAKDAKVEILVGCETIVK
ncbi:MAG: hypothetical protein R3B13_21590 [Polyangiaceae bacterium]